MATTRNSPAQTLPRAGGGLAFGCGAAVLFCALAAAPAVRADEPPLWTAPDLSAPTVSAPVVVPKLTPAQPAPTPPPAPIDRLPRGMTLRPTGMSLEIQAVRPADGQTVTVGSLPLAGTSFETLYTSGYLYVARGASVLVVVDVRDPMQPRVASTFSAAGEVSGLWGGTGSLIIQRRDGAILQYDVTDPAHPRYAALLAPPAAPSSPGVLAVAQSQERDKPPPPRQSRLAISVHPFLFFANNNRAPTSGGGMLDFGYQYAKVGGLWWGIELSPMFLSSYYNGSPWFNSRVWFGYAGRSFGLGASFGSGLTPIEAAVQFGLVSRFGQLDKIHALVRISWSVIEPIAYPSSGRVTLDAPISQRFGLRWDLTGDVAINGFHTTLGLQTYVGGDRRWKTTVLTTGLGFAYMQTTSNNTPSYTTNHPGVIFTLTYEPRF